MAAQGLEAQPHKEPVLQELAAPVRAALADGGVRVTVSGTVLDFWWVKSLAVTATPLGWAAVPEGSLVGAVRLSTGFRDIRARAIRPGVYTLRYGVQPENGDHLGTSPFRDFLLLVPAAFDTEPPARGHKGTIELSIRTVGGAHPAVWSIDPPIASEAILGRHTTELGHEAVVFEVQCVRDGKPAGALRFGLVLVGSIDA